MNSATRPYHLLRAVAVAAALVGSVGGASSVPVSWVGPNNGYWDVAGNWSSGLPSFADEVTLSSFDTIFNTGVLSLRSYVGSGRLTITGGTLQNSEASMVGALALSGGVISGTGALTVGGPSTWSSGAMTGAGSTTFSG
ncbi:hypothetical protein LNV09_24020, partial [Paucibacter sp. B2R-40]|uniref:hypothetical protein n=1 Tax=Paucibacter sp. B2R-40 TaxID=2893554 RepID=UPI0021E3B252